MISNIMNPVILTIIALVAYFIFSLALWVSLRAFGAFYFAKGWLLTALQLNWHAEVCNWFPASAKDLAEASRSRYYHLKQCNGQIAGTSTDAMIEIFIFTGIIVGMGYFASKYQYTSPPAAQQDPPEELVPKSTYDKLAKERGELQDKLNDLAKKNFSMDWKSKVDQEHLSREKGTNIILQQKLISAEQRERWYFEDKGKFEETIKHLDWKLAEAAKAPCDTKTMNTTSAEVDRLNELHLKLKKENIALKHGIEAMESHLDSRKKSSSDQQAIAALQKQIAALTGSTSTNLAQVSRLQEEMASKDAQISRLHQLMAKLQDDKNKEAELRKEREATAEKWYGNAMALEKQKLAWVETERLGNQHLSALASAHSSSQEAKSRAEEELLALRTRNEELATALASLQEGFGRAQEEALSLRPREQELSKELSDCKEDKRRAVEEVISLKAEKQKIAKQLADCNKAKEQSETHNESLKKALRAESLEKEKAIQAKREAVKETSKLKDELTAPKVELGLAKKPIPSSSQPTSSFSMDINTRPPPAATPAQMEQRDIKPFIGPKERRKKQLITDRDALLEYIKQAEEDLEAWEGEDQDGFMAWDTKKEEIWDDGEAPSVEEEIEELKAHKEVLAEVRKMVRIQEELDYDRYNH